MATVLQSLAVPHPSSPSNLLSKPRASIITASFSSLIPPSIKRPLPQVTGLRVGSGSHRGFSIKSLTRITRNPARSGRIVCEAQDTAVEVPSVTDDAWQLLVLESESPVLVEFWAPWCGPCRLIHPIIDELGKQYAGKLKCYRVNTDECPSIATRYGIRSIPTVMIFKNGERKGTVIGAVPKTTLTTSIEKFL